MRTKTYSIPETEPDIVAEPAVAYLVRDAACHVSTDVAHHASTGSWGPNALFNGTQEEFLEHIHRIEEGEFMTLDEFDNKFEAWKTKYLTNKLK